MDEDDPVDEISRIEVRLEELAEVSERCRKIILVSKAAIASGVALLLVMMLGLLGSGQVATIGSGASFCIGPSRSASGSCCTRFCNSCRDPLDAWRGSQCKETAPAR